MITARVLIETSLLLGTARVAGELEFSFRKDFKVPVESVSRELFLDLDELVRSALPRKRVLILDVDARQSTLKQLCGRCAWVLHREAHRMAKDAEPKEVRGHRAWDVMMWERRSRPRLQCKKVTRIWSSQLRSEVVLQQDRPEILTDNVHYLCILHKV